MYEDILLPFDGSDGANEVLQHASDITHWADATLHLLYVADTTRESVATVDGQVIDTLVREGEDILDEAVATLNTRSIAYDTNVVQGNPAPTIVEYAERYGHELIVMPTHGREGISRYLTGSVTEKVVRLSSVPVLTVRMQPEEQIHFPYESILIPTDGSSAATNAAEHGLSLAASLNATVHVLSVIDDTALGVDVRSAISHQKNEQAATDAVDEIVSQAETHGVTETVTQIEHGRPANEILDYIKSNDIHAVAMGTTGRRGTDRILFGSVAEKTVRSAPVPVVTVAAPE